MKLPREPKAVIFDMDGLLFDTIPLYLHAMIKASTDLGQPLSSAYLSSLIGLLGQELHQRLSEELGPTFPVTNFLSASHHHLTSLLREKAPVKAGAAALLQHVSSLGVPLAVATSTRREEAQALLQQSELEHFFHYLVGRDDVERSKPHPDVYLKAASLLQFQASSCLALEDSFNGIRSAYAAGCMVVMVPDAVAPTEEITRLCVGIAKDLHIVQTLF